MITGTKARELLERHENTNYYLTDEELNNLVDFLREFVAFLKGAGEFSVRFNYSRKLEQFESYQLARKE